MLMNCPNLRAAPRMRDNRSTSLLTFASEERNPTDSCPGPSGPRQDRFIASEAAPNPRLADKPANCTKRARREDGTGLDLVKRG